jgi:glycosyltransferase involved in cell wall biosynthesis
MNIKISILVVVFNDPDGLEHTLRSLKQQKEMLQNNAFFNCYVVDGGSGIETINIINKYLEVVTAWVSESDNGIYDAMNKSANMAIDNSYLLWINAGDELLDIAYVVNSIKFFDKEIQVIYAPVLLSNGLIIKPKIVNPLSERTLFPDTVFRHQGFLILKEVFWGLGGYKLNVGLQADGLIMSLAQRDCSYIIIGEPIALFQLDGISNKAHTQTLLSYFKVANYLGMNLIKLSWFKKFFILKCFIKILLPDSFYIKIREIINFIKKLSRTVL